MECYYCKKCGKGELKENGCTFRIENICVHGMPYLDFNFFICKECYFKIEHELYRLFEKEEV